MVNEYSLTACETMDLARRITETLRAAQHPEAQRQPDKIRVDGFVVEPDDDGSVQIRWEGGEAADPLVDLGRRFFLARHGDTLNHAGIQTMLVEGPGEPYLHCLRQ